MSTKDHARYLQTVRDRFAPRPFKGNSDPFSTTAVPITPIYNELLVLSFHWTLFSNYPVWAPVPYESLVKSEHMRVVQDVIGDAALLHCLFAAGYYIKSQHDEVASYAALGHKTRVLELMQQHLRTNKDVTRVTCFLILLECFVGNFEVSLLHWQALRHMLEGSSTAFRQDVQGVLNMHDVWFAYHFDRKTILDVTTWDVVLPKSSQWLVPDLATVNRSSVDVDSCLLEIMSELRQCVAIREVVKHTEEGPQRDEMVDYVHVHSSSVEGRLINHYIDLAAINNPQPVKKALNTAVALAIMCFVHAISFDQGYGKKQSIKHAQMDVFLQQAGTIDDRGLSLWLYFMAALNDTLLPKSTGWAIKQLQTQLDQYVSWPQVEETLGEFLYSPGLDVQLFGGPSNKKNASPSLEFLYNRLWFAETTDATNEMSA